jgi:mRNA-degrading endonuclease RelE of RelBE toxin-antitoxin system
MSYSVDFEPVAARQFRKLERVIQKKRQPKIRTLTENPRRCQKATRF